MFRAALLITAKTWKQTGYPSVGKKIIHEIFFRIRKK